MRALRVIFMGTPEFAVPILVALADRPELGRVVAVVSQPDRPAGRGQKLAASPVKSTAEARGIAVLTPTKLKPPETRAALAELAPDVIVVAAYGRILPPSILELPPLGCVNVHASLLPRHRGASPVAHAILAGDQETGISIMRMDEGCDTGPVYCRQSIPIEPDDTTGTLTDKLAALGAELLVASLPAIRRGELKATPQDPSRATQAPLLTKEDGRLDFTQPAVVLERRVRAMDPWPGTFVIKAGERTQVLRASVVAAASGEPGTVLAADQTGVIVRCGEGALRLQEVRPAGRRAMAGAAWVAGRGVTEGERFDSAASLGPGKV